MQINNNFKKEKINLKSPIQVHFSPTWHLASQTSFADKINNQIMKKIITVFVLILALLSGISSVQAQEKKTVLEINSTLHNTACNVDLGERNCVIEKKASNITTRIASFSGRGCQFTSDQTLSLGKYTMVLSGFGFEDERVNFEVTKSNKDKIIFNTVNLKDKITSLGGVTVYGSKKQYIKVEADKTTVSVKSNAMLNSGNSFDALKRLPGVIVSPSRNLSLNGKDVKIYIDGAPSTLNGTDLENYLSSLPANTIEKVELIYNPGAAFEANSSGSVINIVTSSKHQKGVNAIFNINYNFNKYQNPSPQILLNGKTKNLSWQTMLGYNHVMNEELVSISQTFTSFIPVKTLYQDNFKVNTYRNVYFRLGTNYKLSARSNLLFNYNNTFSNDKLVYQAATRGDGINFTDNGITNNKHSNHEISLQYSSKLDSLGRTLYITAFVNTFKRDPINEAKPSVNETNRSDIDFGLTNAYLKYDFSFPFKKSNFSFNTGGKYNSIKVRDRGNYNNSGIVNMIDFNYTENNLAFYAEARKKVNKLNFTAGLRFEDFNIERLASTVADKVKYNNTNLFPNASALYEINSHMNLSASWSKKIKQPSYNIIDPNNSSLFNQFNSSTGDIALKPAFINNYELKLNAFQFLQAGANYTVSKNDSRFIFNALQQKLVSNESFQSFDKIKTFSTFISFPVPLDYFFKGKEEFLKRMHTIDKMNYLYLNVNYVRSVIDGYSFPYGNKGIVNFSVQSQLILPWNITNIMAYSILTKGTWEVYRIDKPIQQLDISFNRDFLKKKMKVGLHCFDVFNKSETNGLITGQNLSTQYDQKKNTRVFRISLTYNLGNLNLKKENTEIQNEKIQQSSGLIK